MQNGYDLYLSEFKYFIRLQSACSYQGKLQTNYAILTFCDFKHRVMLFIEGPYKGVFVMRDQIISFTVKRDFKKYSS